MMGGLAYMTGLPDRPLRAGSSVVDIMGGTFGAVGILAALRERDSTGKGKRVDLATADADILELAVTEGTKLGSGQSPSAAQSTVGDPTRDGGPKLA